MAFLEFIPAILSAVGALGKKSGGGSAMKQSEQYYGQLTDQARSANEMWQAFLPELLRRAGYNYTPGRAGTPGTSTIGTGWDGQKFTFTPRQGSPGRPGTAPQIREDPNWNPMTTPAYSVAKAGFVAPLQAERNAAIARGNERAGQGIYTRGGGASQIDAEFARDLAGFNRDYYSAADDERKALLLTVLQALQGQQQAGTVGASGLAQLGQAQQGRADARQANAIANFGQALEEILYRAEKRRRGESDVYIDPSVLANVNR